MLFKMALFLLLSIFVLFTRLQSMSRENSVDSFIFIDQNGQESENAHPNAHKNDSFSSPTSHAAEIEKPGQKLLPPLQIPAQTLSDIAAPTPSTPNQSESLSCEQSLPANPRLTPQEQEALTTTNQKRTLHSDSVAPQPELIPVTPITPTSTATQLSAAVILSQTNTQAMHEKPRTTSPKVSQSPTIAKRPLRLPKADQEQTLREHRIDIAPISPIKKNNTAKATDSEQDTRCCLSLPCPCLCAPKSCVIL